MIEELTRRKSNVQKLREFFVSRPLQWVDAADLEPVAGRQAWRTRVSELRQQLEKEGAGTIENKIERIAYVVKSRYRFLPHKPLGRDAAAPVPALPLLDTLEDGAWQR